ncbi:MAG: ECF-type sigma factor, partial [Planctomycetota bacterium]
MNDSTGSISTALPRLKKGDSEALQQIWDQFFEPLKRVAQERVNPQHRKVRDEEDLALSAINAFHECVKNG